MTAVKPALFTRQKDRGKIEKICKQYVEKKQRRNTGNDDPVSTAKGLERQKSEKFLFHLHKNQFTSDLNVFYCNFDSTKNNQSLTNSISSSPAGLQLKEQHWDSGEKPAVLDLVLYPAWLWSFITTFHKQFQLISTNPRSRTSNYWSLPQLISAFESVFWMLPLLTVPKLFSVWTKVRIRRKEIY